MECSIIVTTCNRRSSLYSKALYSISLQTLKPKHIVIVNDGEQFNSQENQQISTILKDCEYYIIKNSYSEGAAGSWNSGLKHLIKLSFLGYVALLDDDDTWDNNHLELNMECTKKNQADVVVSGLRMIKDNKDIGRKFPSNIKANDFLKGNPGWQGSNTFVSIETFKKIKGFRNGLKSTNDRDIAFRILSLPNIKIVYTNKWTSSWFHESDNYSLSLPRSDSKIEGLQWFWYIYKRFYDNETENDFFNRAAKCFGIQKYEIINIKIKPKNTSLLGDLDV